MALRFLLVSLVAGMGLDLPSGLELSGWASAGREWAEARMVDLGAVRSEAGHALRVATDCERAAEEPAPIPTADAGSPTADLAFDVVVEGMAMAFAADQLAGNSGPADPMVVVEQPRGEAPRALAWNDPEPGPAPFPAEFESRSDAVAPAPPSDVRASRLGAAVRLTREALVAWAALIEGSSEILTDTR